MTFVAGSRFGNIYLKYDTTIALWIWIILDDVYADFCRGAGSV